MEFLGLQESIGTAHNALMVKGLEQSVLCSYTFEGQKPSTLEQERMAEIVGAFALNGYDSYSVLNDVQAAACTKRDEYQLLAVEQAKKRDLLFAVIMNERRDDWIVMQAGAVLGNGGRVVLAYHENAYGASPVLQRMSSQVISWNRISGLLQAIHTEICDNRTNDRNTFWQNQRKTA